VRYFYKLSYFWIGLKTNGQIIGYIIAANRYDANIVSKGACCSRRIDYKRADKHPYNRSGEFPYNSR
jgi:hypothetical protein